MVWISYLGMYILIDATKYGHCRSNKVVKGTIMKIIICLNNHNNIYFFNDKNLAMIFYIQEIQKYKNTKTIIKNEHIFIKAS